MFPERRMRRRRITAVTRDMLAETALDPRQLIYPVFVQEDLDKPQPIPSMPGQFRWPLRGFGKQCDSWLKQGVRGLLLFGIPSSKDAEGTQAWVENGVVQEAVRQARKAGGDGWLVVTDVCMCEYTDHGHCGIIEDGYVNNDRTLEYLVNIAASHAEAGADWVAPSDMMDGRVAAIRERLDDDGFDRVSILSYAVKYASAFYGPFRQAADSAPAFGDRRQYQMDPRNVREALQEAMMDEQEGADMLMVKPALPYLDILTLLRQETNLPLAAYQVSGEYSMIKAAAANGWLDGAAAMLESLTAIRRAGADVIVSYFVPELLEALAKK